MTDDRSTEGGASDDDGLDRQAEVAAFTLFALRARSVQLTVERAEDVARRVLRVVGARVVRIVDAGSGEVPPQGQSPASRSAVLAVPVLVEGRRWGQLAVSDHPGREFGAEDADFLLALAAVLGAAVLRQQTDRGHAVLASTGELLLRGQDASAVAAAAVHGLRTTLEASAAAIVYVGPSDASALIVLCAEGLTGVGTGYRYTPAPGVLQALAVGTPVVVEDRAARQAGDGGFAAPLLPGGPASGWCLAVPVVRSGRAWGWLVAAGPVPRPVTRRQLELAERLAALIGRLLDRQPLAGPGACAAARTAEVALLDTDGMIVWVNDAWRAFSDENGGDPQRTGVGVSYLERCAADPDDPGAQDVAAAIRAALIGDLPAPMCVRIPCPDERGGDRWFDVLVSCRQADDGSVLGATVTLTPSEPGTASG